MEIDESELKMMMSEFWAVDNNDVCEKKTIIFLKRHGLADFIIRHPNSRQWHKKITSEDEEEYLNSLEDYR